MPAIVNANPSATITVMSVISLRRGGKEREQKMTDTEGNAGHAYDDSRNAPRTHNSQFSRLLHAISVTINLSGAGGCVFAQ